MTASVSGIVLAGGRSSRFGADKMAHPLDGRPLVLHAIEAVGLVVDEVIVVAGSDLVVELPATVGWTPVRVVHDAAAFAGPLAGVRDGAAAARGDRLVVVAGDMPTLRPAVLRLLLDALGRDEPTDPAGAPEAAILSPALSPAPAPAPAPVRFANPLPMALRRAPALDVATRLLADDRRSLRALLAALRTTAIPPAAWQPLDPGGATFRDIDTPDDLARLEESPSR